jgi:hypothetical protein
LFTVAVGGDVGRVDAACSSLDLPPHPARATARTANAVKRFMAAIVLFAEAALHLLGTFWGASEARALSTHAGVRASEPPPLSRRAVA